MKLKIKSERILLRDVILPSGTYETGSVIYIVDAYFEDNMIFVGFKAIDKIEEAGFYYSGHQSKKMLKRFIEGISIFNIKTSGKITVCHHIIK